MTNCIKISKWGNSLAVRIPRGIITDMKFTEGSEVELITQKGEVIMRPCVPEKYNIEDLLGQITPENTHPAIDWGEPRGNEI